MPVTFLFWLRRSSRGVVAWIAAVTLMVTVVTWAFLHEASTPADAARFGASLEPLAISVRPLFGEAVRLDTAGGFVHWRLLGLIPLIVGAWVIVFTTKMTVREERRGTSDLVLATPVSRGRFMVEGLGALTLLCLGVGLAGVFLGGLASRALGADFSLGSLLLTGLGLGLLVLVWGMLAALAGQLTLSRATAGAASALSMVAVHVGSNVAGSQDALAEWARLLPTGAYFSSLPLIEVVGPSPLGLLTMALQAIVLGTATVVLFVRRDLNVARSTRLPWTKARAEARSGFSETPEPAREARLSTAVLRGPVSRDAWALKGVGLGWAFGLSALVSFLVSIEPTLREPMEQFLDDLGPLASIFAAELLTPGAFVAVMFGMFLAPALSVYAILQAGRWAGELQDGLMALDLSTPLGRARLLISRVAAVLLVGAAALGLTWLAALSTAAVSGVPVSAVDLARAALGALPVALVYLGVGLTVAAWWRPSWAAPAAGALALLDFVYGLVASTLELPGWAMGVSIFSRYGNPALEGLRLEDHGLLVVVGCLLVVAAVAGFRRLDMTW